MKRIDIPYEYYYTEFCRGGGGIIPKDSFVKFIEMAWRELIPLCTSDCGAEFEDSVRQAVCLIAEELFSRSSRGEAVREDIDGYSVTYSAPLPLAGVICAIAVKMLGESGVLFAGVEG